ncbi:hypothetical protein B0H14DRAFT_3144537 [Mycena olivaceomarginata]|nr:hypothetical protein B0H14DRAFT_3144537 [Mycena olivaceomarginata]
MAWIMALGHISDIDPRMDQAVTPKKQREIAVENLRLGLWDVQRFDYLPPNIPYSKTPNFNLARLESWPNWKEPHPEVRAGRRANAIIYRVAFNLLAFTQPEMMEGLPMRPPKGFFGNWIGVKAIMCRATLDITAEGGRETPFVLYYEKTEKEEKALIMEILDVKRVPWPEPGPKVGAAELRLLEQLLEAQTVKFGARPGGPLVPMMQTPKIPLVAVRYSYMESHPEGGAQFLLHLESRLRELLPSDSSDDDVRAELEKHLEAGEEMLGEHIRMFARLLSHSADLVDKEWANDQQSHWNISTETKEETRVSFFMPCLRPRLVEEIETGKRVIPHAQCENCKKDAKALCSSCRAVIWVSEFGFASLQESVKMGSPPVYEPPRNQYGGERFIDGPGP